MRCTALLLIATLASACVSKNNHELVKMQLDATRTALSTHQAACRSEAEEKEKRIFELESQLAEARIGAGERDAVVTHLEEALAQAREELAALIVRLPAPPPPDAPPPKPPKPLPRGCPEPEPPAPFEPAVAAAVEEVVEALAIREAARVGTIRAEERHRAVAEGFRGLAEGGWAEVIREGDASVVRIPSSKLFVEGRVVLSARGEEIAAEAASALTKMPGWTIEVRGHTDDTPFQSAEHPSNWELGFDRAMVVLRVLEERGVPQALTASSWADRAPLDRSGTDAARKRNARVELWLRPVRAEEPPVEESGG